VKARDGTPLVVAEGLWRRFLEGEAEHVVLAGADLAVAAGEFVALVGPSGSGKSTLLNILGGIDLPDAGRVRFAGLSITDLDERARTLFRRRELGFVFQFFNLIPTLTVEENLLLPLELNGLPASREAVRGLLERVGLAHRAGAWPDRLSGGEQQRVAVARALVHRPRLLLADEPTGNLDADTGEAVLDVLAGLVRAEGATLIVATHSERVVRRADRVLLLRQGRLEPSARWAGGVR
jgi:putative ABC transport system ATP-binding protein